MTKIFGYLTHGYKELRWPIWLGPDHKRESYRYAPLNPHWPPIHVRDRLTLRLHICKNLLIGYCMKTFNFLFHADQVNIACRGQNIQKGIMQRGMSRGEAWLIFAEHVLNPEFCTRAQHVASQISEVMQSGSIPPNSLWRNTCITNTLNDVTVLGVCMYISDSQVPYMVMSRKMLHKIYPTRSRPKKRKRNCYFLRLRK